jgi:membrane protease YdiL (CAAX protease family)
MLQVLSPLAPADLLWVAVLPAASEELLFRGALIPAISPDWWVWSNACARQYSSWCFRVRGFCCGVLMCCHFVCRRGALIAGVVFGLLHTSGGRNAAFAAWASAVGCTYGAAFLYTSNIYVPVLAHSLANVAAGALWMEQNSSSSRNTK